MAHKLQPSRFIEIILKKPTNQNNFYWEPADMRAERFDTFIDDLEARFKVIDWDWNNIDREKIEILGLLGDTKLREIIKVNQNETEHIKYEDLLKKIREAIFENSNQLLLLAQALNISQYSNEPLKNFYHRVDAAHAKVDWDTLTSMNIKDVLVAATLARGTSNVFLRGYCTAVKSLIHVDVDRIKEEGLKIDTNTSIPSNHGFGFGGCSNASPEEARFYNTGQGLFGNTRGSSCNNGQSLFGRCSRGFQLPGLCGDPQGPSSNTGQGLFGNTQGSTTGGLFGSSQPKNCTFGSEQPQGGGLFGAPSNVGGSFGASNNQNRSGFSFGSGFDSVNSGFGSSQQPNVNRNNQQAQNCFGNSNISNQNSCFGSTPKQSLFGGSNQGGLFGTQSQQNPFNKVPTTDNVESIKDEQSDDISVSTNQTQSESSGAQNANVQDNANVTENTETLAPSDI